MQAYTIVAEGYQAGMTLPEVDVVFNAIGDADRSSDALRIAAGIAARTAVPVINDPARILATGRSGGHRAAGSASRRRNAANRTAPARSGDGRRARRTRFSFPLLLRSPGFHTGRHFELVERPEDVAAAAAGLPGDELFAIEYLDVRGPDGAFRKYRAIIVGDRLYPLHLAIANQWKVHYFSADMRDRPDHRAEEAQYLADMTAHLGRGAVDALDAIRRALGARLRRDRLRDRRQRATSCSSKRTRPWRSTIPTTTNATPTAARPSTACWPRFARFVVARAGT